MNIDTAWRVFASRVEERLKEGQIEYGDKSFAKDPDALITEIQQELEDIAGWGLILWVRLERVRANIKQTLN